MIRGHFLRRLTVWFSVFAVMTGGVLSEVGKGQQPAPEGSGPQKNYPKALAVAPDGTIYFADRNMPGILQLKDGTLSVYFAGSKKFRTPLNAVHSLAMDAQGRLLAGDSSTRQVYRFDENAQPQPIVPFVDTNLGPFGTPLGLAVNSKGDVFISDREFRCIWRVPAEGGEAVKFADVQGPGGICIDPKDQVWVVSLVDNPLRRFSPEGKEELVVKGRPFEYPNSVALDESGTAYVVDGYKKTIWKVAAGAEPEEWLKHNRFINPVDVKFANGQLLVVDPRAKALVKIQLDGTAEVVDLELAP
jgi:sugar lactone lactonase YvrE